MRNTSRRSILKSGIGLAAAGAFPAIVPSSVFGATAPSNRLNIGAIGVGRISRIHDMKEVLKIDGAQIDAALGRRGLAAGGEEDDGH